MEGAKLILEEAQAHNQILFKWFNEHLTKEFLLQYELRSRSKYSVDALVNMFKLFNTVAALEGRAMVPEGLYASNIFSWRKFLDLCYLQNEIISSKPAQMVGADA